MRCRRNFLAPGRRFRDLLRDSLHGVTVKTIPFLDAARVRRYSERMDTARPEQRRALDRQVM